MPSPPSSQIVWDDVLGIAPELTTTTASGRADILAYVNNLTAGIAGSGLPLFSPANGLDNGNDGGITLRLARMFLAAHVATVAKNAASGAAGPVTSEAAGGLRISYGLSSLSGGDPGLSLTQYGITYLTIVRSSLAHGPVLC